MKSPKRAFQETKEAKAFLDLATSPVFLKAIDAAMLQMQYSASQANDHMTAAANCFRMDGARRFAEILLKIADPETPAPRDRGDNLPHID